MIIAVGPFYSRGEQYPLFRAFLERDDDSYAIGTQNVLPDGNGFLSYDFKFSAIKGEQAFYHAHYLFLDVCKDYSNLARNDSVYRPATLAEHEKALAFSAKLYPGEHDARLLQGED
jgi:hypothetical protein